MSVMYLRDKDGKLVPVPSINGEDGTDGKSAYEIAVENGFEGDEAAWLESLKCKCWELYTYSTEDLVEGESELETGKMYLVYE